MRDQCADPVPGGAVRFAAQAVTGLDGTAQRLPRHGRVAVPLLLHVDEGVPVRLFPIQDEGEDRRTDCGQERRDDARPVTAPVTAISIPKERQEGQDEEDTAGATERRADADQPRQPGTIAPPEVDPPRREKEKERLGVDGGKEERRREERQGPDGSSSRRWIS